MSFFEDVLYSAAPVAAGFIAGPAGYALAAGAATGAGIAAMRGQDPIMGAVTGGFGGVSGGGLANAAGGLGTGAGGLSTGAVDYGTTAAGNATLAGNQVNTAVGMGSTEGLAALKLNPMGTGTGITAGTRFSNMMSNPGQTLSNYGGGDKFKGAGKLGSLGLPAIGEALVPDYNANPDDDPRSKYDPNRRLNVGMTTGIQNALKRDSGLRLNQPFMPFNEGGYLETGMGDGMSDDISTSIEGEQPAALSENEFVLPADVVSHIGNGSSDAGAKQLYAMMDRIRKDRTGNEEQGRDIMPQEYMPA